MSLDIEREEYLHVSKAFYLQNNFIDGWFPQVMTEYD